MSCSVELQKLTIILLLQGPCFGHVGDGNFHATLLFNPNDPEEYKRCKEISYRMGYNAMEMGGTCTGEHGVGVEKRELMCEMFNNNDIQQQIKIKKALDESSLLNPGKVYPILRKCAEEGRVHVHRGKTKFPDIPRF